LSEPDTGTSLRTHPLRRRGDPVAPPVSGVLELLRTDAMIMAAGVGALLSIFLQSLALDSTRRFYVETGADLFFVALAIVALLAGLAGVSRLRERRFWRLIAAGFSVWALIFVLFLTLPERVWNAGLDLGVDALYLIFYLPLLVAVEGRPDLAPVRSAGRGGGRYRLPAVVVFGTGLFLYFVLIPALLSPDLYESMSPSFFLYIAFDLYLAGRLLVLARLTGEPRWRRCFHLTAAIAVIFLVSDIAELLVMAGVVRSAPGTPWQALWLLPGVGVVVAVRLRALPIAEPDEGERERQPDRERPVQGAPFFAYALVFPLIHFSIYRAGLFEEATRPIHESFVLLWMLCLGVISLAQHLELERKHLSLVDERRTSEERLWYLANFDPLTGLPNPATSCWSVWPGG
jgi:hypothetical protein